MTAAKVKDDELFRLTCICGMVTYATMGNEWKTFYRLSDASHILEVKKADGGEPHGHSEIKKDAKKGEWLCRNPENGHTWVTSDEGMLQLYKPVDKNNSDWNTLVESQKTKKKKETKEKTEKISLSFDPKEAGPLFFDQRSKDE